MKIAVADVNEEGLAETVKEVAAIIGQSNVIAVPTDVSKFESVVQFREKVYEAWGEVRSSFTCPSLDALRSGPGERTFMQDYFNVATATLIPSRSDGTGNRVDCNSGTGLFGSCSMRQPP